MVEDRSAATADGICLDFLRKAEGTPQILDLGARKSCLLAGPLLRLCGDYRFHPITNRREDV